jgi:hypothetical protein
MAQEWQFERPVSIREFSISELFGRRLGSQYRRLVPGDELQSEYSSEFCHWLSRIPGSDFQTVYVKVRLVYVPRLRDRHFGVAIIEAVPAMLGFITAARDARERSTRARHFL